MKPRVKAAVLPKKKQPPTEAPRPRGFAAMNKKQQREIARMGGQTVSRDRRHMAEIGRKGGSTSWTSKSYTRS